MLCAQGVWTAHNRLVLAALSLFRSWSVRKLPHLQKKYFAQTASQPGPFFAQCQQQTEREREREAGSCPPEGYISGGPITSPEDPRVWMICT